MGRRSAERPSWFPEEGDTDPLPVIEQSFGEPYQPQGHTGMDYSTRREALHPPKKPRRITEQTLAILFGVAIGFFIAGIVYLFRYYGTLDDTFRQAALIFNGTGVMVSGIVACAIAGVHLWRTRKDN